MTETTVLPRLSALADAAPALAESLALVAAEVTKAHRFHWLGTDSRLRLAWDAIEHLAAVAQYQQTRIEMLAAEVAMLRENGGRL